MPHKPPRTLWDATSPPASDLADDGYWRLKAIIGPTGILPISRSTWYNWIEQGRAPPPVALGPRIAGWRKSDIRRLLQSLDPNGYCRKAS
ncbi:helix-turn-helix transcriptional regulator [Microvirga antarctica]|uniref:helix-turn-helix transcriptional regulator n=1 Tax=Microvirga antarctica TaxID=2819233 RepID=UPI001B307BC6|nr:AlpA family phage regulatory protein [Microvirga antarctica]